MVATAERHREFVAGLAGHSAALRKPKMMSIGWNAATNETRLICDKSHVTAIAHQLPEDAQQAIGHGIVSSGRLQPVSSTSKTSKLMAPDFERLART